MLPAGTNVLSLIRVLVAKMQMYAQKFHLKLHISFSTSVTKLWQTPGSCPNISLIDTECWVHACACC